MKQRASKTRVSALMPASAVTALIRHLRQQDRSVAQQLLEPLGEAHQRCAVDDVVVDAENQMNDVALDQLAVLERRLALDRTDRERQGHGRDRYAGGGSRPVHAE